MKKIYILTLSLAVLLCGGCAHKKKVKPTPEQPVQETAASPVEENTPARITSAPVVEEIPVEQPTAPVPVQTLNIQRMMLTVQAGGQTISTPAALRWERGKAAVLSIQPFMGIEMFRMELNADGLTIIDKVNICYARMSFEQLQQMGTKSSIEDVDAWIDANIIQHLDEPTLTLIAGRNNMQGQALIYTSAIQKDVRVNVQTTNIQSYKEVSIEQLLRGL